MRFGQITIALLALWFSLSPICRAEFTMEMKSETEPSQCTEPTEGSCSEVPWKKEAHEATEPNVQAPTLPPPNRNVDSYMDIDNSTPYVKGDDGLLRSKEQAAVELNNEAVRRMNEGRHDEATPMFEKAREIMGDAPEGPCFEETSLEKFNRNVINQNNDTVFKYDANRYDKTGNQPSVQDVINSLEPGADAGN